MMAMVGLLNAFPGTRLYQRLLEQRRLTGDTTGNNTDFSLNFTPLMSADTLMCGYRSIIDSIYAPRPYYQRVKRFLEEYRPRHSHIHLFKFSHLATAWKTTVRLGIIEKERSYFWRLFFWSLFHRPRQLPLAMVLTACGFHFRKSFEQH